MSGGLSVPFALAGLYYQGHDGRKYVILAFVALTIFSLRVVWTNYQLLEKQKGKFTLFCSKDIASCAVPNAGNTMRYFRMVVETDCINEIEHCVGHLIKIEKDAVIVYDHDPRELPFAPAERNDCLAKTISPNIPYHLDVLCTINHVNRVFIATQGQPCDALNRKGEYIFADNGEYILHVSVSGKGVPTANAKLIFNWQGQWQTAIMEKVN
jgi:hypothetical protein